jgi:hypothetical protein
MARLLAFLVVCTAAPLASQPSLPACQANWREPVDLRTPDGRPVYVEGAQGVRSGSALLFGAPTLFWASSHEFDPPPGPTPRDTAAYLRRLRSNHGYIGVPLIGSQAGLGIRPPATKGTIAELFAAAADGRTHVVWLSDTAGRDEPNSVWYSELRESTWSTPVEIFRADVVGGIGTGPIILVDRHSLDVLVSFANRGSSKNSGAGIAHISRRNGQWARSVLKRAGLPSSPTGVVLGDETFVMAFVAGDATARVDNGSHVFVAHSSKSRPAWRVSRVHWAAQSSTYWPYLFKVRNADGRTTAIVLVWTVKAPGTDRTDSLFVASSLDSGLTWSSPRGVDLGRGVVSVGAVMDTASRLHIVAYSTLAPDEFGYRTWTNDNFQPPRRLRFGEVTTRPTFFMIGRDSLMLFWGKQQAASAVSRRRAPIGRFALLTSSCTRS